MATTVFRPGNTALITGGASGIGLALAKKCLGHGMRVAIVDIDEEKLEAARKSLGRERTSVFRCDVSRGEEWAALREKVEGEFGSGPRINLLALNAGISPRGSWPDAAYFHKIFDTNLFGVIHGLSTFLPGMQAAATASASASSSSDPSSSAHAIVITGSKQGITNPPGNPAYNASKAAIKSLAEHLSWDLRPTGDRPADRCINVHLLVPGWTYTGLTGGGGNGEGRSKKPSGAWTPEQVVEYLETKMRQGSFYIVCPDNDVDEETDRRRMLWSVGDMVEGRPPLTRWREEWKGRAEEGMKGMKF